jgi:hypothetical protein
MRDDHDLAARIARYVSIREQAVAEVGGLTTSRQATEVVGDSRDLADRIATLRRGAVRAGSSALQSLPACVRRSSSGSPVPTVNTARS